MDWLSIVIIAVIVVGLILLYGLTGTGSAINCLDKHKARNNKHFKKGDESEQDAKE